ncbi:MAG: DsbC family protein [Gammaproteobacteria bacterium]|nr:DsbC family protein [Gammaproteobacteria bacterium]NND39107.1 DsbC family protein [Pseudomonadales bacterium]MBT8152158.1 DsbC family protein [Gammaproteobacteria bacterium]NNL11809.1 DsbC family protein [Pseudomonadales bacterium]NNM12295.1 DsbC family protein [Pseudomonadales bacterium]
MKNSFQAATALFALLISLLGSHAALAEKSNAAVNAMLERLQGVRPDFKFNEITKTDADGIYRVTIDRGPTIYLTEDGEHFFVGDFYSVGEKDLVDEGEMYLSGDRASSLSKLASEDMIIFAPKTPKAHIYVFTDVDCYYCQKLHREVGQLNDLGVEVRYLAYPRAGVNSPVHKKLASAWCAKDPQTALTKLKAGEEIPENDCKDNPIAEQFHLGNRLGVSGTPAIFSESGKQLGGYVPAAGIAKRLGLK